MWGRTIGAVAQKDAGSIARFEYEPSFAQSGIQVAPLTMPLSRAVYQFAGLRLETFRGLPGLLADSLPDRFGNALIDAWLAGQGRDAVTFSAVERLCYTGSRGMGALEFSPAIGPKETNAKKVNVDRLVQLASEILQQREQLNASLKDAERRTAMGQILKVGTSAGGARAKAVVAWNRHTNELRSGQMDAPLGFEHWLIKFDGVRSNRDKELADPMGYGAVEYAYAKMAKGAGIDMNECALLEEGNRRHFMTRRFDRTADGQKLHMLSLGALAHFDFNAPGAHSYEQAFQVMRQLGLSMDELEQMFLRMTFNIVARNQDDHVKNIAFLMDKQGRWVLAPAYDVTYAYQPDGAWTGRHQMTLNGKQDDFGSEDFRAAERVAGLPRGRAGRILTQVGDAVASWLKVAREEGVPPSWIPRIAKTHRLDLCGTSKQPRQ